MGEVFLAEDVRLNRRVALKVLPEDVATDKKRLRRFEQEARAASALNHPNILTVYEFGLAEGVHFIASELVEGKTLREAIINDDLALADVLRISEQVAFALSVAHTGGIVHRDLKPENIMIRHDLVVKILDFGLAKLVENSDVVSDPEAETRALVKTIPGVAMGTVNYMSPEQARGKEIDARTDIWSLGVVLYEMISGGKLPFTGETSNDTIASILRSEPPLLSQLVSNVSPELERIVGKCLRKSADYRYQNVKDLQIDLRDLQEDLALQSKLERSQAPNKEHDQTADEKPATQVLQINNTKAVSTQDIIAAHPSSRVQSVVSQIKRNRHRLILSVLILAAVGIGAWFYAARKTANDPKQTNSIAVLPFQNTSGNNEMEYLSDGISEALINSLTELQELKVIARTTAFRYKGQDVDPQAVGQRLDVQTVLMGHVRQIQDRLTIQVDLVDTSTGAQIWGREFESKLGDVISVKQAIAREVTENLRLKLSGEQQQKLVKHDPTNAEAYRSYLRGRYYWNKRTEENVRKAIAEFQRAVELDPSFALAYTGLADSHLLLGPDVENSESDLLGKAKAYAQRALQIDDSLAEGHTSLAGANALMWQWAEADKEFRRAIELNPNYPTAHHWYSIYLMDRGRLDEALTEIKRAHELDPLSRVISYSLAQVYILKDDVTACIEQAKKILELDPDYYGAYSVMGKAYLRLGRYSEAVSAMEKAFELSEGDSQMFGFLGYTYALSGQRLKALEVIKDLEERFRQQKAGGTEIAAVYLGLDQKNQVFAWIEKDIESNRRRSLIEIRRDWIFRTLRGDPSFPDLARRIGLDA